MDNNSTDSDRYSNPNGATKGNEMADSTAVSNNRMAVDPNNSGSCDRGNSSELIQSMSLRDINLLLKKGSKHGRNAEFQRLPESDDESGQSQIRSSGVSVQGTERRVGCLYEIETGSPVHDRGSESQERLALVKDKENAAPGHQGKKHSEDRKRSSVGNGRRSKGTERGRTSPAPAGAVEPISFGEAANKFLKWRKELIGKETEKGWKKNSRNIWEFSWDAPAYNIQGQFIGVLKISYADQNPMGRSREARMIASKTWQYYEAGWLWATFRNRRIWLGKATPEGSESVRDGKIVNGHDGRKHFFIAI